MFRLCRRSIVAGIAVAAMLSLAPANALAGTASVSYSGGTLTVVYPDSSASCNPSDTITVSGIAPGFPVTLQFLRLDETTGWIIEVADPMLLTDANNGVPVPFPYPAIAGGTLTFIASLFDNTLDKNIKGWKWTITCQPPPGGQGCTPGYWKNHLGDWPPTGYAPSNFFDVVFGTSFFSPTYTLNDAIRQGGGGVNRLARHGTAALLSAAHPSVAYPYTVAQVIAMVQGGVIDPLAQANELGCRIR